MAFRRVLISVFALGLPGPGVRAGQGLLCDEPDLLGRWDLVRSGVTDGTVWPVAGALPAQVVGPLRFSPAVPHALMLDGNARARHRVAVTDTLLPAWLPRRAVTVEAWVCVDKPKRWGGVVGAIRDTGSRERGWFLGTDGTGAAFCFGVVGTRPGRITYLTDPQPLALGEWYHIVGTYDGYEQRLYVDGRLVRSAHRQQGPTGKPLPTPDRKPPAKH